MKVSVGLRAARNASAILVLALALSFPAAVNALSVADAKQRGFVVETSNGYLRAAPGKGTPEVEALVRETNAARRQQYREIAERLNVDLSIVERDFGKRLGGR